MGKIGADFGEEFVGVGGLAHEVDEEVVGCDEFCTLSLNIQLPEKATGGFDKPFSGALLSTSLPVTSFFSTSSFWFFSSSGVTSACVLALSGVCFF